MANLIRTPKSGREWTQNDLLAYNIRVEYQDTQTFFGIANLPQPNVDNEVLIAPDAAATQHDNPYIFLRAMDLAMAVTPSEESAIDDFTIQLFKILRYTGRAVGRIPRTKKNLPFSVCGEQKLAEPDVCIMDDSDILLLVQEQQYLGGTNPEPQLIAEAIATFYNNNNTRVRALGLPALQNQVIPGITMKGTMPIFYKMPITTELVHAVQFGEYPAHETVVYAHLPVVPRPDCRYDEGMIPLDNRHAVLSCYEAFKQFL